ncbi:magnesium-translocating P-type ATPase [Caballeronia sp. dw_19]|uniref:magnesium-translocating P-type ATPase n=1 Tax=Caballeronia sp. dw_19 TaxID=2719791 RepID=UPI001BD26A9C|nr:magnesium-translocating P-type ATPase [Caballeronia sp. dw_19]
MQPFWNLSAQEAIARLSSSAKGLSSAEALIRFKRYSDSRLVSKRRTDTFTLILGQFSSPIVLLLVAAAIISILLKDSVDAVIILAIVLASGLLGFWQERGAAGAVEKLLSLVEVKAKVLRGGSPTDVALDDIVPGDVVILSAGATAPGDCLLLESRDLFADEATLTGETFPAEKSVAVLPAETPLAKRTNFVFLGTHVISGSATVLVVTTGKDTEFGKVSERLKLRPPETDFERGIRRFGYLLMEITLLLVICIFAFNVYLHRPVLDSFLFSLALAVGLTPQMLPAIVSINLAAGARRMAEKKVIVKRLSSIENFGSMNVLCTDKTGTLTEGEVTLQAVHDVEGKDSPFGLVCVYLNSTFESGFASPIDVAIRKHCIIDITAWKKLDEVPYDFVRKRLTVLVSGPEGNLMLTKGALAEVLDVCTIAEDANGNEQPLTDLRSQIDARFAEYSKDGQRTLGLARKKLGPAETIGKADETGMCFIGFVLFSDPLKPGIAATIEQLRLLGVALKVITGDNMLVAASVARQIGFADAQMLSGREMKNMSDGALLNRVGKVNVFAEVEPNEKERIIRALRKAGNVVGYMGDGINDASALHAADVGLSVEDAVDVAKEVADIVLLEKDLKVLIDGIREGRITFANTLKYVLIATSANFGNMFSMAGASLLLPFLPLLPKQILLTNMLTDLPAMTISSDGVDSQMLTSPQRWDIGFIRSFMLTFGILSSVFDYVTFGVLLYLFHAGTDEFRTAWFVESVVSASLILLVVRSRLSLFTSRPSRRLVLATLAVAVAAVVLPYFPYASLLGLAPVPLKYLAAIAAIVAVYICAAEVTKRIFYRRFERTPAVAL